MLEMPFQIKINFIGQACKLKIIQEDSFAHQTFIAYCKKIGIPVATAIQDLNTIATFENQLAPLTLPAYDMMLSGLLLDRVSYIEIRTSPRKRRRIHSLELLEPLSLFPLIKFNLSFLNMPQKSIVFVEKEIGITSTFTLPVSNIVLEDLELELTQLTLGKDILTFISSIKHMHNKLTSKGSDTLVIAEYAIITK